MDNKIAVQRLFRGVLLRTPSSSEEKLFTKFFDDRSLSYDQLAVLGWQSSDFMAKVAPIALLDYALSGVIDGQRIIGWYNSPAGAPLAPTGTDNVLTAIEVMLSGYGISSQKSQAALSASLYQLATRLGYSTPMAAADNLASIVLAGNIDLASLLKSALLETITLRPEVMYQVGAGLLVSVLGEKTTLPGSNQPPITLAETIINQYLAPKLQPASGTTVYESSANDGSLDAISLDLTGVSWRGRVGDTVSVTTTLPTGLTAKVVISGAQTAEVTFSGKARAHDAAASTTIALKFSDTNFNGAKAVDVEPMVKGVLTLDLQFYNNNPWTISGNELTVFGTQSTASIDLNAGTGQIGLFSFASGELSGITSIDARGISGTVVSLTGSSSDDTLYANHLGSTIRGGAGDDTLFGGSKAAKDTFVFEAVASPGTFFTPGNGMDSIHNFQVGAAGDILDFRSFLGTPTFVATSVAASAFAGTTWANGDIRIVTEDGTPLSTPAEIAAIFGAPTAPAKLVIITAGVPAPGDPGIATVWFISNRSAAGSVTAIEAADEVVKVAELVGINNLALLSFQADNFLV